MTLENATLTTKGKKKGPQIASGVLRLEDNLSYRMSVLNHLMTRATSRIYNAKSLNSHQWKVLSVIYHFGPMQASEVLKFVILDKAAVSRALQELKKSGYIERELHHTDARTVIVSLTTSGTRIYVEMAKSLAAMQKNLFSGLSASDVAVTFRTFSHLESRLRRLVLEDDLEQR